MRRVVLGLYRVRGPIYGVVVTMVVGNPVVAPHLSQDGVRQIREFAVAAAPAVAAVCVVLTFLVPRFLPTQPSRAVHAPVRGRWLGMNSPASKVPSHGIRAYGQAYAIDLVHEPVGGERPTFGGDALRAPTAYPAFGHPVLAMVDGTVVRASGWRRDHRARSNWLGFAYLVAEGAIRELGGPGFVVGNHVTIRSDDGLYATVAHLQRGSLTVSNGDRVRAGQQIGSCGNSGNSSEPHVHAQLMDRASLWTAQGIPMAFHRITIGEGPGLSDALPRSNQHMFATSPATNVLP